MSILVHPACNTSRRAVATRPALLHSAFVVAKTILGWPLRVHANRKLLNQMAGMSARDLADIGLTAADLQDTAALPPDTEVGQFLSSRALARRRVWNDRWM